MCVIDVADDAEAIALVKLARLGRNVGLGVAQAMKGLKIVAPGLRHDLARQIAVEAVNHDAIHVERVAQLTRRLVEQLLHVLMPFQPGHDGPQQGDLSVYVAIDMRLDFDDRVMARRMNCTVEGLAFPEQIDVKQTFDLMLIDQRRDSAAQPLERTR